MGEDTVVVLVVVVPLELDKLQLFMHVEHLLLLILQLILELPDQLHIFLPRFAAFMLLLEDNHKLFVLFLSYFFLLLKL